MDSCSFELENVCGMIQGSGDSADWRRVSHVSSGPGTDHSNMGQCEGNKWDTARIFTQWLQPLSSLGKMEIISLISTRFINDHLSGYY